MRPFLARGSNADRCASCLMAKSACFCDQRQTQNAAIHFILLYHRDEIHKPTNSGRLIADLFPNQTQAFIWSRTEPEKALLNQLNENKQHCTLLFPNTLTAQKQGRAMRQQIEVIKENTGKPHTFVILDGTWKQASKMFHQSEWLKTIPHFEINQAAQRSFLVRHSQHDMQFATAEVTAMLLDSLGHKDQSEHLLRYYQAFNQACLNSRKRGNDHTR
nr:tRNA-uridine aminocarboxypropyltransferase [Marinomonas posidonica]